jgi:hypothetical protein
MKKGIFYIITPISLEQLQQVDTLLQGRVEIPEQLLQVTYPFSFDICEGIWTVTFCSDVLEFLEGLIENPVHKLVASLKQIDV